MDGSSAQSELYYDADSMTYYCWLLLFLLDHGAQLPAVDANHVYTSELEMLFFGPARQADEFVCGDKAVDIGAYHKYQRRSFFVRLFSWLFRKNIAPERRYAVLYKLYCDNSLPYAFFQSHHLEYKETILRELARFDCQESSYAPHIFRLCGLLQLARTAPEVIIQEHSDELALLDKSEKERIAVLVDIMSIAKKFGIKSVGKILSTAILMSDKFVDEQDIRDDGQHDGSACLSICVPTEIIGKILSYGITFGNA